MKCPLLAALLVAASVAVPLDGQIAIHDPSTVVQCDGSSTPSVPAALRW
jgi:hypothetical protein